MPQDPSRDRSIIEGGVKRLVEWTSAVIFRRQNSVEWAVTFIRVTAICELKSRFVSFLAPAPLPLPRNLSFIRDHLSRSRPSLEKTRQPRTARLDKP